MNDYRQQPSYQLLLERYRSMFAEMSDMARSIWFFASDESEILSFEVGPSESVDEASARHAIKLFAMADALASVQSGQAQSSAIRELRELAEQHLPKH